MSNTGAPQFPQPGQYRPEGQQRAFNSDFRVGNLDKAPNEIRAEITAERKAIRLEGEITRVNQDGSVRVATERGDVEIRLNNEGQQRTPQIGERVELSIQPAPRTAPEQPPQVTLRPAPPATEVQAPQVRVSATPVQVEVRDGQAIQVRPEAQIVRPEQIDQNAPPPPNRFPDIGSLVRLEPVAPEQMEQLIQTRQLVVSEVVRNSITPLPVLDVLPQPQQQPSVPVTAQVAAQVSAQAPVLNTIVSAELFVQPQNTSFQATTSTTILQPLATAQVSAGQPQSQQVILPSLNTVFTQNTAPTDSQITVPVLTRAQAAVVQLQTIATQQGNETAVLPTPQDARIGNIQPPQVLLTQPSAKTSVPAPVFIPDATLQPLIINSQKAVQITGTVIAKTEAQVPIVQFSIPQSAGQAFTISNPLSPVQQQTFILQFPSEALVLGSRIDVTPQSLITTNSAATQPSVLTQALPVLPYANVAFPQAWPVMQEIQQTLLQQTAQAAAQTAQAFTATIPNPSNAAQFGPAALFFVAALRGGDLGSWLGDKASEILRQSGKNSLLTRLTSEAALPRAFDAPPGEWRGMNIPLLWQGDIKQVILHYKHDAQGGDDSDIEGNKGTRFVFDLNLDVMGKVQLDGLFRPVSRDGPRLDVVLRTEERFSAAMQGEMRRLYMDAIKPSQVGGELSFQDGSDAWVMIDAQDPAAVGVSA